MYIAIVALADGGVKMGLPRQLAQTLAAQTVSLNPPVWDCMNECLCIFILNFSFEFVFTELMSTVCVLVLVADTYQTGVECGGDWGYTGVRIVSVKHMKDTLMQEIQKT